MTYSVTMTSRMLAIAGLCVFLLCVLLFLLGIELGKRFAEPAEPAAALNVPSHPGAAQMPATPHAPSAPTVQAPAVAAPSVTPPSVSAPGVTKP